MVEKKKQVIKRRVKKRRVCSYCVDKVDVLDYKDVAKFRKFITDRGKIVPRRNSGICAKHQRELASAIKRARFIALIPFTVE
ncbi:30S ribosomal protein S18 [bacterium]|nr:30S ribosomal protein S18 [bacterium]